MHERFLVSRRKAAMLIAGTFSAVAAPAAAAVPQLDGMINADAPLAISRSQIGVLLREVRHARSAHARVQAFAHCKVALRSLDAAQLANAAPRGAFALYRHPDPSAMLARVIVRELDAMPTSDPGWMARLNDLEAIFQAEA